MEDPRRRFRELVQPALETGKKLGKRALKSGLESKTAESVAGLFRTGIGNEENPFLLPGIRVSRDESGTTGEPIALQETRQRVFEREGILPENRQAYSPRLSEHLYEGIRPFSYANKNVVRPLVNYFTGKDPEDSRVWDARKEAELAGAQMATQGWSHGSRWTPVEDGTLRRSDAWRLYLGMPQEHNTFRVATQIPTDSENPDALYLAFHPEAESELIRPDFLHGWLQGRDYQHGRDGFSSLENRIANVVRHLKEQEDQKALAVDNTAVMGNYTLELGQDENGHYISYYDLWDLDQAPGADKLGQPFEIYGRIYYDPRTFERIR